ncbi:MAG: AmmeMemoRadiSam system protein A, partial [Clostridiales bacterium]
MGKILGRFILPHPPILIPQIGGEDARKGQGTLDSFAAIGKKIAELKPQNIIIISPQAPMINDKF